MNRILLSILIIIIHLSSAYSQCNVKTINRPDGTTVRYLNPELVGVGTNCELGLSVSFNGESYQINTTVRYSSLAKKQIGTLKVQLQSNDALVLNLFNSELATTQGSNVSLGVYLATNNDIIKLRSSPLVRVVFTEANGVNQIVTTSKSNDLLMRQIKCLEETISQYSNLSKKSPKENLITYRFGDAGLIKIPDYWTIFDGKTDKEIISKAVTMSGGRYQPTPGKYTIIRCNGYKGKKIFTLKLSYTVLEQIQTISELRLQKIEILEMMNNDLASINNQIVGTDMKLVKAFASEYVEIGGGIGGKISYIKQQGTNPQRKIIQYMLYKDNRMFLMTLGWDVSDESNWITEYNTVINSLNF